MPTRSLGVANRRQFIVGGITGSALFTSLPVHAGALLADPVHAALSHFVFDARFDHGTTMADDFGPGKIRAHAITGDVSEVWYDRLLPRLQAGRKAIGGLTTSGGLFVISRLGHDAGLTLALHGTHFLSADDNGARHALDAPEIIQKRFDAALVSGVSWTSAMQAALLAAVSLPPAGRPVAVDIGPVDMTGQVTLHSWLLLPRG